MAEAQQFVFAYGSLVQDRGGVGAPGGAVRRDRTGASVTEELGPGAPLREAYLRGHRRTWGVAMENALSLPGYKYYLDAADGSRPDVFVTFLDLVEEPGARVNGALLPVDAELLAALDRRERNYARRDVTSVVELVTPGGPDAVKPARVWTYFGKDDARRRARDGRRVGRGVVHRAYLDGVRAGFAALADGALAEFEASTIPHGCRVLELSRVELG